MQRIICAGLLTLWLAGCSSSDDSEAPIDAIEIVEGECEHDDEDDAPDSLRRIGCRADFDVLASEPLDTSIPGARSVKVVLDQLDTSGENQLYFQNSVKYPIHYDFTSDKLSGGDLPR